MLPLIPYNEAPESPIVRRAVAESRLRDGAAWQALGLCTYIEAYTDGSAPVVNPGGPAGFAAVLLGWAEWEAPSHRCDAETSRAERAPGTEMGTVQPAP